MEQSADHLFAVPEIQTSHATSPQPQPSSMSPPKAGVGRRLPVGEMLLVSLLVVRVICTTFTIFLSFLVAALLLFSLTDRAATDALPALPLVEWCLSAVPPFLVIGVTFYCILSCGMNLRAEWKKIHAIKWARNSAWIALDHDLWSNAKPMWMHLSAAIVFCSLSYAFLRVAGYTEEISLRLSIIFLIFSLGVPVVTAAQSDRGGWHLSAVGSKFLVALVILDISILAVGPIAASWIVHLILDRAGEFLLPRVGAGIIAATFGGLVLPVLARVPVVLAKLLCARVCHGALVISENNGRAESLVIQRRMTIYRPGRIITVSVRILHSLLKPGRLVVLVRTWGGGSLATQTLELRPDEAIRIDLWNTLKWK